MCVYIKTLFESQATFTVCATILDPKLLLHHVILTPFNPLTSKSAQSPTDAPGTRLYSSHKKEKHRYTMKNCVVFGAGNIVKVHGLHKVPENLKMSFWKMKLGCGLDLPAVPKTYIQIHSKMVQRPKTQAFDTPFPSNLFKSRVGSWKGDCKRLLFSVFFNFVKHYDALLLLC